MRLGVRLLRVYREMKKAKKQENKKAKNIFVISNPKSNINWLLKESKK